MTSKPRSKDSEQSDAILYYFVKTEENQGSFCVLGIFRLTCFISYTSLYHLYITSIYHVRPCHGLLRFDPMWRGLLWGWSTTEFAQALQLFTFSTMAAWQTHSQKKVIHRHSIHKIAFFFSSWIFGWGSRSFFWTSRISGRVSLQNLQNLRPESLVDGLNETISRTDTFLVTPFLDANKKGPKVGQRLWLYHKSYPEMWIFCTLKSITYKMTTMLRVESQPF